MAGPLLGSRFSSSFDWKNSHCEPPFCVLELNWQRVFNDYNPGISNFKRGDFDVNKLLGELRKQGMHHTFVIVSADEVCRGVCPYDASSREKELFRWGVKQWCDVVSLRSDNEGLRRNNDSLRRSINVLSFATVGFALMAFKFYSSK